MSTEVTKDNILKLRIDDITLDLLEKARSYVELNKSKFIRQSIRANAEAIISEHEKTKFSREDWHMFFDMVDSSPEPTKNMKRAAKKYHEIVLADEV